MTGSNDSLFQEGDRGPLHVGAQVVADQGELADGGLR